MRKLSVLAMAAIFALCLTACGSSGSSVSSGSSATSSASSSYEVSSSGGFTPNSSASSDVVSGSYNGARQPAQKDFDGSKYEETGDCSFWLRIQSGDNRDGGVLQIATTKNNIFMQIDVAFEGGDGSIGTVYIDGMENRKVNISGDEWYEIIDLEGSALDPGIHDVELVQMDGDAPTIYKKSQYEIVV